MTAVTTRRALVSRTVLSRRTFLKATGVALSLPLLDAMTPALTRGADQVKPPRRLVAICATLGFHTPFLFPNDAGLKYTATPYLETLKDHRQELTVISGISHPEQSGANGHSSEMTWLTSAKRPGLAGFKNTVSLDQYIAEQIGIQTRFPYLALSSGGESLSWTANGVPIPGEESPSRLFRQLFIDGTPAEVKAQMQNLKRGQSILDTVRGEAKKLDRSLGGPDREKLDEYLSAVRGLETRLQESEGWANKPKPKVDAKPPTDIGNRNDAVGRARLMYEMIVLALQTDSTRTVTLRLAGLNQVPVIEGVTHDWHGLSHHGLDPAKIEELKLIELAEFKAFAEFLGRLKSVKEGGRNLLEGTSVLFGSNLGNASAHDWRNLPIILAGGGFKHMGHLALDRQNNTPLSNLFVSLACVMGVQTEKFGSSTAGGVKGLEVAL
jgi:hypothetical protein